MALQTTLLASNRHLRDILQLKGYRLRYVETPGNHEPVHWRRALPDALIATLGG
jgi:enterochelin esterase family protein